MYKDRTITVVIPALNEELSIARVVKELLTLKVCSKCHSFITKESQINHECVSKSLGSVGESSASCRHAKKTIALVDSIVLCDNGSTDNTAAIARDCGAIVIQEPEKGYGAACLAALSYPLEKDIVVFVDGDHSVDCTELPKLIEPLYSGGDLVIGSRTLGNCEPGALSVPQIIGNKLASALMRLIWKKSVTDLGPFRAVDNKVLDELDMRDKKFGWTVEMQVRAFQLKKNVVEVPVNTRKRVGESKISGTLHGVIGASKGILGTIAKLYWQEKSVRFGLQSRRNSHRPEWIEGGSKISLTKEIGTEKLK